MPASEELADLLDRAAAGDTAAVAELFSRYRKRLKRMVRLRLSRHLQSRLDDSDIFAFGAALAGAIRGARLVELTPKSIAKERHAAEVQNCLEAFLRPFLPPE